MRERIPIFIDCPSIYSIVDNQYRNFGFIFKKRANVYLDMDESEIDKIEDILGNTITTPLADYFKQIEVTPFSGKTQFMKLYNQRDKISTEFNGCIFILDINKAEAKSLSEDSGIWIISKEEIEADPDVDSLILDIIYMDNHDVKPQKQYGNFSENGWIGLFNDRLRHFPPFNEIIIYDNFLNEYIPEYESNPSYSTKRVKGKILHYTYIGLENLLLLLDAILPSRHSNILNILIAFPKFTNERFEKKIESRISLWIEEIRRIRQYKIAITILLIGTTEGYEKDKASHPVHPRVLYTNFFFIGTEKGFKIFEPYPYSNIVRKDGDSNNSVSVASYLHNPKQLSNPIKSNYNNKLKDIGEQLAISSPDKMGTHDNTLLGDCVTIESFSLFENIDINE